MPSLDGRAGMRTFTDESVSKTQSMVSVCTCHWVRDSLVPAYFLQAVLTHCMSVNCMWELFVMVCVRAASTMRGA